MNNTSITDILGEDDAGFNYMPAPEIAHFHNLEILPSKREIHLTGDINEDTGAWFYKCMRWLEIKAPTSPIRVVIATNGGDVESMFTIHDTIRNSPCPVQTVGIGEVLSAGVLILACGDHRLVHENIGVMAHEFSGADEELGQKAWKERGKFRDWQAAKWAELLARYTQMTPRQWTNKLNSKGEFWLLGSDAIIKAGIADAMVEIRSDIWDDITKRQYPYFP